MDASTYLLIFACIIIIILIEVTEFAVAKPQRNNHQNISMLLDNLLRGYDNSVRPDFGGPPAIIEVDIMVRSMGPISEVEMTYSMDCYFRQSWVDQRLAFLGDTNQTLALSISMLARIWKPDTYFYNGKQSYLHTITTPNKFVRLYQDGRVLYSSRIDELFFERMYFGPVTIIRLHVYIESDRMDTCYSSVVMRIRLYCELPKDLSGLRAVYRNTECPWQGRLTIAPQLRLKLTIKAGCPMNLEDFPMDIQRCPLKFGSFGYTAQDVIYRWNDARQVAIAEDMKLSQFDLIATPAANHTDTVIASDPAKDAYNTQNTYICEYSMLLVSFHLQRHMGNFLIQVYGPCILLVVLSWVSFWLNREATADRVSLGITTVLTMTFLGLEARTDLPKVPYPTALDFFVFLSFAFIFATIIQFAVVHYFTKYGSGECYFSTELSSDSSSEEEDWKPVTELRRGTLTDPQNNHKTSGNSGQRSTFSNINGGNAHFLEVIPLSACSIPMAPLRRPSQPWRALPCIGGCTPKTVEHPPSVVNTITTQRLSLQGQRHRKKKKRTPRYNSVSKIDRASRIVFPLLFLTINLFYWYSYLSRTERITQLNVK
ncbi:Glycine receptor [Carabus blaptoides fortunei]